MHRLLALSIVSSTFASAAFAADVLVEAPIVPMVTVSASASASVANDRLHAWLRAEAENASPAAAANEVNARVAKAIARTKSVQGLTVQTSGYTTQQVGERGHPIRWRVAQMMSIEGSDFATIAALVTRLQDDDAMLLSGLAFAVSDAKRRETEDALTQQALAAWRTRAQNAATGLGFAAWRPAHVTVNSNDFSRPQPTYRAGVAAASGAVAPVPLEGGATDVTVTVTGDAVLENARVSPH
jgi:predicted secreted protein